MESIPRIRIPRYFESGEPLYSPGTYVTPRTITKFDCAKYEIDPHEFEGGVAICLEGPNEEGCLSRWPYLLFDRLEWVDFVYGAKGNGHHGEFDFLLELIPPGGYQPLSDSKVSQPPLYYEPDEWSTFIRDIKAGLYDEPPSGISVDPYYHFTSSGYNDTAFSPTDKPPHPEP